MKACLLHLLARAAIAATVVSAAAAEPREKPLEAPGPLGPLRGTLLSPAAPATPLAPVLLIVPGSGPTDRDGNSPLGVKASTYRLLAEGLAAKGIATVRIDKRGLYGSAGAVADPDAVTIEDYAEDVRRWVDTIREASGAGCVWVLGHSEGGMVALAAAAARQDPAICGLVLVASTGRPMGQVLREQLRANPANAPLLDQAMAAIDALEAGRRVEMADVQPALRRVFHPKVQGFLISAFAIDPAKLAGRYTKPLLIVQGGRDLQVGVADAQRLRQAAAQSKLVLLPEANHVLKAVETDDRAANLATYGRADLPLAPEVVDAIADFVLARQLQQAPRAGSTR
jgi:uncharacterized protein